MLTRQSGEDVINPRHRPKIEAHRAKAQAGVAKSAAATQPKLAAAPIRRRRDQDENENRVVCHKCSILPNLYISCELAAGFAA